MVVLARAAATGGPASDGLDPSQTVTVVLLVAGVLLLLGGAAASRWRVVGRRRERDAVPALGVVRDVQLWSADGPKVRLRLAWSAPDGSGVRVGEWHGGGGPWTDWRVGQQVPLRVGRHDDWVQVVSSPRQSVVDGCVGAAMLVLGVLLLLVSAVRIWL